MDRLITRDETLVHDPESKIQSKQWKHLHSPPPKKARVQPLAGKVMLNVFCDLHGVVMVDFFVRGYHNYWGILPNFAAKSSGKLSKSRDVVY